MPKNKMKTKVGNKPGDPLHFCSCDRLTIATTRKELKNKVRVYWQCECGSRGIYFFNKPDKD